MYGYIYKTTDLTNGKIYVGQHKCYLSKYKNDADYYGSGIHLINAMKLRGKENFINEIIEECNNEAELNDREKYWIAKLDAMNPEIGYNLTPGGQDFSYVKEAIDCFDLYGTKIATYESMMDAARAVGVVQVNPTGSKRKHSIAGYQWKKHNDANEFIDIALPNSSNAQMVEKLSLEGESLQIYRSLVDAVKDIYGSDNGNYRRNINKACNTHSEAYGFLWEFYERSATAKLADKLDD